MFNGMWREERGGGEEVQDSGYEGVLVAGHSFWARSVGALSALPSGDFTGLHKSAPYVFWVMEVIPFVQCRIC